MDERDIGADLQAVLVSAGEIRACGTVSECVDRTRATTGCGGCVDVVRRLVGEASRELVRLSDRGAP